MHSSNSFMREQNPSHLQPLRSVLLCHWVLPSPAPLLPFLKTEERGWDVLPWQGPWGSSGTTGVSWHVSSEDRVYQLKCALPTLPAFRWTLQWVLTHREMRGFQLLYSLSLVSFYWFFVDFTPWVQIPLISVSSHLTSALTSSLMSQNQI